MHADWPFFRTTLSNMDMVLSKSDIAIASRYAELVDRRRARPADLRAACAQEWQASIDAVLAITRQQTLLETNPLLARSIRNRFPYIDPLNHVQIELLRRHRAGDTAPEVVQGIHLSINGIAAGCATVAKSSVEEERTMEFKDKVALVTGGSNGIGRATALGFAGRGAKVVIVDRDATGGEATAGIVRQKGGEALFVQADVTDAKSVQAYVKKAVDTYGRIDCFHNNAGIEGKVANIADYDEAMFDQIMAVNVRGVFLGLKYVLKQMLAQKGGAIVNTASTAGLMGSPGMNAYVASKHAVLGLTKTASGEVARQGIRVNAVCPGPIDTRMIHDLEKQLNPGDPGKVEATYQASIPIGRYGTAEEVANTVLFLCSDLAGNITGAHFVVDGGRTSTPGAVTSMNR